MTLTCDDVRDLAAGFVLGALTPEEEAAVRDHLASCEEPHPELAELGGVVPHLAESVAPVEPPVALRARILAAAAADRPAVGSPGPASAPIPFPTAGQRTSRASARASRLATWAMGIAAVLAIAVLGAWNLQLQGRLSDVEGTLAAASAYQEGVARVLEVATQPGAQTAIMATADPAVSSARGLAATGPDGTVVISMHDLVPTTGTQVYEAWVIVGEAAPVPLGQFRVDAAGTGVFDGSTALAEPGAILALTLEPGPGATTPTAPVLTVGALSESG